MAVDDAALFRMAQKLRRHSPRVHRARPAPGHPTTCMSAADIMSVLFFDEMRFDPRDPSGTRRRRVRAVEGPRGADPVGRAQGGGRDRRRPADAAPAPTARSRAIPRRSCPGCAWPRARWARASARPRAWPGRAQLDGEPGRVYALLGDGEVAEGSVWEAAQFASFHRLDNLCAIVDVNRLGQSGPTMYEHDARRLRARASRAFGWEAAVGRRPRRGGAARRRSRGRAQAKGKPFAHRRAHAQGQGRLVPRGQGRLARQAGEEGRGAAEGGRRAGRHRRHAPRSSRAATADAPSAPPAPTRASTPAYTLGQEVATREAYGTALAKLGAASARRWSRSTATPRTRPSPSASRRWRPSASRRRTSPSRTWSAPRSGMATEGKIPFASTFACFLTRAYDFIRMAVLLAAGAPRAVRQPRRRLDRRGRRVADGARGPGHDARAHSAPPCSTRATRSARSGWSRRRRARRASSTSAPRGPRRRCSTPTTSASRSAARKTLRSQRQGRGHGRGGRRHACTRRSPRTTGWPTEGIAARVIDLYSREADRRGHAAQRRRGDAGASSPSRTTACAAASARRWRRRWPAARA